MATITAPPETLNVRVVRELPPEEWYKLKAVMPQADPHGAGAGKHGHH